VKQKFVAGMITFVLVFSFIPHPNSFASTNSSGIEQKKQVIKERDKQILQLEKKKKLAQQDQADILNQIETTRQRLNNIDLEVAELEQKVNAGQAKADQLKEQVEKRRQLFDERLRSLYLQGRMFYFSLLLNSSSFGQFLERFDMLMMMNRGDQEAIEGFTKKSAELQEVQQKLKSMLAQMKDKQEKAQNLYSKLQADYKMHKEVIASLSQNVEDLEDANAKEQAQLNRVVAEAEQDAARHEQQGSLSVHLSDSTSDGELLWPVAGGVITSPFGMRYHPIQHTYRMHEGIDIGADLGTPIRAAAAGQVIEARSSNGYGYIVVIYHGNGLATLYAHMYEQTVKVKKGDFVKRGQVIAEVGTNGNSTGPHLHFEVHVDGKPVNPMQYLR
jgi:murein DD-endopeptidase MepM/ murein hydrolase activator NlpD